MKHIFWGAVFFLAACGQQENTKVSLEHAIQVDSVSARTTAEKFLQQATVSNNNFKELLNKSIKDSPIARTVLTPFNGIVKTYDSVLSKRTDEIIQNRRYYWEIQYSKPNPYKWWIIIGIILGCGALGGFAAPRYQLITDLLEQITQSSNELTERSQQLNGIIPRAIDGGHDLVGNTVDEVQKSNERLQKNIADLKRAIETSPPKATSWDYILFGILGAAIVPIALLTSNSKVLDFKNDIDYLLFAAFCVAGALFSKTWLKSVVEKMKS